jgi:branched-chain amino acid transport system substrate-binding protein
MIKTERRRGLIHVFLRASMVVLMSLFIVQFTSGSGIAQQKDAVPGVTSDKIKLGVFCAFTGPIAHYGKTAHLAEAVYDQVNKMGGIHGRKIEVVEEDDGCDPIKGVAAAKKLIHQDKVFALHGAMCSNVALAIKKEVLEAGIPYMNLAAASYKITMPLEKNIFSGIYSSIVLAHSMADFAMSKPGAKRVAVIKHTDEWGMNFYDPLLAHLKKKYNVTPVVDVTIERGITDATPQVLRIKQEKPDVIIAVTYLDSTTTLLRDAFKLGLQVPIVGSPAVAVDEQFQRLGNPDAMKLFFAPFSYKYPLDHPVMLKWGALLKNLYPKDEFDMLVGNGFGGTLAIVQALKDSGRDLTREKFVAALEKLNNFQNAIIPGYEYPMCSPVSFSPTDHVALKSVTFSVLGMKDKKLQICQNYKEFMAMNP